ncbi:MAG: UbiD family decarboxylase [Candidatus Burarchaeum sp.]|nr:UbiD family decarboxylase [Candidatus Burarchaeum sp.]MDO8339682.1 UbiD family decarboxylase [Candidatus Burarchaeum sp.]
MELREFLGQLEKTGELVVVKKEVSSNFEMSGVLKALDGKPVLFEKVKGSQFRTMGNIFSSRELIARSLGVRKEELVQKMMQAVEKPVAPAAYVGSPPCQEAVMDEVDLGKIPILMHCEKDGGPYISSGVIFAADKEYGRNCSFHRGMVIGKNRIVLRILPRHLNEFIKRNGGELDVAMCIGLSADVMLCGATSVEIGVDELGIANTLGGGNVKTARCKSVDVGVPAESEFVLEGRITKELHSEGPFVDLTETYDIVREQPVFEVRKITHRKDAIYQALLPGALEHKMMMGMPREPTIFREVGKVCDCADVCITPGGCSWLHGVVAIRKKNGEDGMKAIEAAFRGHQSMKHVVIVDADIDPSNPAEVEWAIATRFQFSEATVMSKREAGSSLDPSADPKTRETSKVGIDATGQAKKGGEGKAFGRAEFPKVDISEYI